MWKLRKLPGEVSDTIPYGASYISRGEEIEYWLNSHVYPRYVILDDIDDFFTTQHEYFIETNPIIGLSMNDAIIAIKKLNSII